MAVKTYRIEFFKGSRERDASVSEILRQLADETRRPVYSIGSHFYELRDLTATRSGASYKGFIAKFRHDDIPHIAMPGGRERNIEMESEEGLIEKNYFSFERRHDLLIFQANRHGCTPKIFAAYLKEFSGEDVFFDPVLHLEPMRRLLSRNVRPKKMELSIARPGARHLGPDRTGFSDALMRMLTTSGGARIHVTITPQKKHLLSMGVKDILRYLFNESPDEISVAKVDVEDGGVIYPIDLIADRLVSKKPIILEGKYPVPSEIYRAINEALDEHSDTLRQIFRD